MSAENELKPDVSLFASRAFHNTVIVPVHWFKRKIYYYKVPIWIDLFSVVGLPLHYYSALLTRLSHLCFLFLIRYKLVQVFLKLLVFKVLGTLNATPFLLSFPTSSIYIIFFLQKHIFHFSFFSGLVFIFPFFNR